jgi:uncharacterized integral membrane protein
MSAPGEPPVPKEPGGGLRSKIRPKHVGVAVVIVVLVIFMLGNLRQVRVRFVGPEVRAPLILALLVAAALGALTVLLIQRLRRRR